MPEKRSPLGNILKVTQNLDGTSLVRLDNGPASKIDIVCHTETLEPLLASDMAAIQEHLMSRKPGHFRTKSLSDRYSIVT
jgi:hypothetical protein